MRKAFIKFITSFSVASMLQSVAIFAFIFIMSHLATIDAYAEYRKTFYVIDFTTAISLFGLNTLLLRKSIRSLYSDILPTVIIINLIQVISVFVFMVIQGFPLLKYLEIVFFISLNTLYQICVSILILSKKKNLYAVCTISSFFVAGIGLGLLAYSNSLDFYNVYILRIVLLAIYILPFFIEVRRSLRAIEFPSTRKIFEIARDAAPIGLGVMLGSCTLYIDKFIASMMDSYQLSVYANGSADVPFVGIAITTMSIYFIPIIHKHYSAKEYQLASQNISSLFLFGWYIGVSVFTLLFCNAEFVINVLYSSRYAESVTIFRIFCAAYLLRIVSYTQLIVALELEKIIIKRMLVEMILQVVSSFLLFKLFGIVGLSVSVILVLGLWSVPYNILYFKKSLHCKVRDLLPVKSMLSFFIKAFLPCLIISIIMRDYSANGFFIFIVTLVLYCIINFREIVYILRNVR